LKKALLKILKIVLPLVLGLFLIYISYSQFSSDEIDAIKQDITHANYWWTALGMFLALLSHLSRAWRWNYMLSAIGYQPRYLHNIIAIGAGYAMNLLIPRSGEVSRAVIVNRTDGVPVDKAIGTIIAERVLDFIILLIITTIALLVAGDQVIQFFRDRLDSAFAKAELSQLIYLSITLVVATILIVFALKYFNILHKIRQFIIGLKEGFMTIWTMEKKWLYLAHTLFIWIMYLLMFYVSIFAIPSLSTMPIAAVLSAFVAGSFAVAFTNGGLGAYPLFIAQVLILFQIPETLGTALGWILWLSQTALVIVYGLISFLLLSFKGSVSTK